MGKKLGGNGLWESSRFMLPQHIATINEYRVSLNRRARPILDEQELQLLSMALSESIVMNKRATIKLFDEYEDLQVIGIVERLDQHGRRVKVEGEWFKLDDIVAVEVDD